MPRKTNNRTFLENQLRYFIARKGKDAPTAATRFRAMMMLAALSGFLDIKFEDREADSRKHPEEPQTPAVDATVQAMLDQAAKKLGGANGNKLPNG